MKTKGLKYGLLLCIVAFSASMIGYVSGVSASRKNAPQETFEGTSLPAKFQNVVQNAQEEMPSPPPSVSPAGATTLSSTASCPCPPSRKSPWLWAAT